MYFDGNNYVFFYIGNFGVHKYNGNFDMSTPSLGVDQLPHLI